MNARYPVRAPLNACSFLLSKPCGMWRVPHPLGVPGHWAFVPWQNLPRVSVMDGYAAKAA